MVVTLEIENGFHVNANPASFDFLIPTMLDLGAVRPAEVRYPAAKSFKARFAPDALNVYEGTVTIVARLNGDVAARLGVLAATVTAQACTDSVCLPPSQDPFRRPPACRTRQSMNAAIREDHCLTAQSSAAKEPRSRAARGARTGRRSSPRRPRTQCA